MICQACAEIADCNRFSFDEGIDCRYEHPDCGCACMHKMPAQWEDMFLVGRPYSE